MSANPGELETGAWHLEGEYEFNGHKLEVRAGEHYLQFIYEEESDAEEVGEIERSWTDLLNGGIGRGLPLGGPSISRRGKSLFVKPSSAEEILETSARYYAEE